MKKKILLVLLLCMFLVPSVQAKTINHFYAEADENVTFSDEVNGSSALAGQSVETTGNIQGVSFLAANKIESSGQSDYLVAAGNSITVSGTVNNESIIAGNVIKVDKSAVLQRDVIILGSDITVKGNLGRNVSLFGNKVSLIGTTVNGNVKIYAEEITVDDDTIIQGMLSYPKDAKVSIGKNVNNVKKTGAIKKEVSNDFITFVKDKIWSFLSLVVIFAVLTLLAPNLFDRINKDYEVFNFTKGMETFSKGLVFLLMVPILAVFLLVVPFALPLSLISLILYFILIYISKVFAAYLLGYKIWQKSFKKDINLLLVGIIGFTILLILELIPGVNSLVFIVTLVMSMGIISDFIIKREKKVK
ncbi:MAG: hypothetical protein IKG27_02435 [Bacilli bacterium]|nr:hypothetical protein [Bacilli bacterium]